MSDMSMCDACRSFRHCSSEDWLTSPSFLVGENARLDFCVECVKAIRDATEKAQSSAIGSLEFLARNKAVAP